MKYLLISFLIFSVVAKAQTTLEFAHCYGTIMFEQYCYNAAQTTTSIYLVGETRGIGEDVSTYYGGHNDIWIIKTNFKGKLLNEKTIGGPSGSFEHGSSIFIVHDKIYIAGGFSSKGGNINCNKGDVDFGLAILDTNLNLLKTICYGGSKHDNCYGATLSNDSSAIYLIGWTESTNGDIVDGIGQCLFKLDTLGNVLWQKSFNIDTIASQSLYKSIAATSDGGCIITGYTDSNSGKLPPGKGAFDFFVIKYAADGTLDWKKRYGGSNHDAAAKIIRTKKDEYIVTGTSASLDGDVPANKGNTDVWVLHIDSEGEILHSVTFGGSGNEEGRALLEEPDGGLVIAGSASSPDGDVMGPPVIPGVGWVFKLNAAYNKILWKRSIGGTMGNESFSSILKGEEREYYLSGQAYSNDGDITDSRGMGDFFLAKIKADFGVGEEEKNRTAAFFDAVPNPFNGVTTLRYKLAEHYTQAVLKVYTLDGKILQSVSLKNRQGEYIFEGASLPAGIYLSHIEIDGQKSAVKKLVLIK